MFPKICLLYMVVKELSHSVKNRTLRTFVIFHWFHTRRRKLPEAIKKPQVIIQERVLGNSITLVECKSVGGIVALHSIL